MAEITQTNNWEEIRLGVRVPEMAYQWWLEVHPQFDEIELGEFLMDCGQVRVTGEWVPYAEAWMRGDTEF